MLEFGLHTRHMLGMDGGDVRHGSSRDIFAHLALDSIPQRRVLLSQQKESMSLLKEQC